MKATVTTYNNKSAHEFESFLRGWEVEFDYIQYIDGLHVYEFDNQDDSQAFQREALKELGENLFFLLHWQIKRH